MKMMDDESSGQNLREHVSKNKINFENLHLSEFGIKLVPSWIEKGFRVYHKDQSVNPT